MKREDNHKILDNSIIVFDTSSLGCIYTLTRDTQQCLVEILGLLKEQIWIPAQVKLEFNLHHKKLLYQALSDCYPNNAMAKHVANYTDSIEELLDKLKEGTFHPYYSQEAQENIRTAKERIVSDVRFIETIKEEQKNIQKELINKTAIEDNLFALFKTLRVGDNYAIDELIAIANEGEVRYKKSMPPGYMDAKEKHGLQKYGDLIIWKEILREAKKQSKDVIFVSEDVKEDWQQIEDGVDKGVRTELKNEFNHETGFSFYKYTLDQFITILQAQYSNEDNYIPLFGKLTAARFALQMKEVQKMHKQKSNNTMRLCCDSCHYEFDVGDDELCGEWEFDGIDERSMGPEYAYCSHEVVTCPNCGKEIELTMHIWEYPVGAFNYQNIEAEGAEVVDEMNLEDYAPFMSENFDTCSMCGERKELMEDMDICYDCCQIKMDELEEE